MRPLVFAGASASLVCSDALDGLELFVVGEEACGGNVAVEIEVDYRGSDDGDNPNEEEETARFSILYEAAEYSESTYIFHSAIEGFAIEPKP